METVFLSTSIDARSCSRIALQRDGPNALEDPDLTGSLSRWESAPNRSREKEVFSAVPVGRLREISGRRWGNPLSLDESWAEYLQVICNRRNTGGGPMVTVKVGRKGTDRETHRRQKGWFISS
jgi:hypothetical protein